MLETVKKYDPTHVSITLTDAAKKHLMLQMSKNPTKQVLRLSTQKTGCSGFGYVTDLVDAPLASDLHVETEHELNVVMAEDSVSYLNHLTIDYQKMSLGQSKLMYINPNATGACGCGESFTTDDGED